MKQKSALKVAFPISSVWFGALVGPSMISGAFAASYFAPYGALGLLLPMLSMGLAAIIIGMGAQITRKEHVYTYSDFANCIYGKWRRVLTPILEVYMVIAMVVGGSAVVSMGGTFFSGLTGLPEYIGAVLISIISMVLVLVLWGERLVRAASSFMSVVMIVGMVLLAAFAIVNRWEEVKAILTSFYIPPQASLWAGVSGAVALGFSNACNALTLCAVEQEVTESRHAVAIGVCSFVLNSLAFILSTLLILPYCPDALLDAVPVLGIINNFLAQKAPWLPGVYMVTMFFALLSSGAPQLHAVAYLIKKLYPDKKRFHSAQAKNAVTGVVYFALCIAISFLGLRTIIGKGYSMLGYLAIPLIVIPICILMPLRYRKAKKEKQNETI